MAILRHRACRKLLGTQTTLSINTYAFNRTEDNQRQDNTPPPPNLDALGRDAKRIYGDHEATELLSGCLLADLACLLQELV